MWDELRKILRFTYFFENRVLDSSFHLREPTYKGREEAAEEEKGLEWRERGKGPERRNESGRKRRKKKGKGGEKRGGFAHLFNLTSTTGSDVIWLVVSDRNHAHEMRFFTRDVNWITPSEKLLIHLHHICLRPKHSWHVW